MNDLIANNISKITIEEIVISSEKQEAIHKLQNSSLSRRSKDYAIKQLIGGSCLICGNQIPSKKLSYHISDEDGAAKLVEYYDDKWFKRWIQETTTEVKDKVMLRDTSGKNENIFEKVNIK